MVSSDVVTITIAVAVATVWQQACRRRGAGSLGSLITISPSSPFHKVRPFLFPAFPSTLRVGLGGPRKVERQGVPD